MVGTLINAAAVVAGGLLGLLLRGGIGRRFRDTIMQGLALCVALIGLDGALGTQNTMAVIVSMVLGALLGEAVDVEKRLEGLGARAQRLLAKGGDSGFAEGFVTASLMFCVGAMAIVGALDSGLRGDHSTLIAKSALDGVSAVIFASAMGPGVLLSAAAVLVYQGAIALLAQFLTDAVVTEMSAVGGLLIVGIAINMFGLFKVRVGNLLPAVFMPIAVVPLMQLIEGLL